MDFHWSLSDSKWPQISRTLLSILADLYNSVVWMVSVCPLIFKSSSPFINPFRIVPSASTTIGITVTFMFSSSFSSLSYLPLFLLSFNFSLWSAGTAKSNIRHVFYFWLSLGLWRCAWCNGYRRRKWTRWHEFKSWTRLIAFHIALIPLGKVWIQLFSLQLWVNSRAD